MFVTSPRHFLPGMPAVQVPGNRDMWRRYPRATVLGAKGNRVFLIKSSPDGAEVTRENGDEVYVLYWAVADTFPDEVPMNAAHPSHQEVED